MKNLTYPLKIIEVLADGHFHSGEKIAKLLGISRVAVHYYIQHIKGLGLDIHSLPRRGYRIYPALSLLSAKKIQEYYKVAKIHVLPIIDSTNTYLMERVNLLNKGECCIAEYQHSGKGRRGRHWIAPFGQNIYLSFYWHFENYQSIFGLSLACAVIIAEKLRELTKQPIQLKWPNDLYLNDKKLAGILVESAPSYGQTLHTVIGIGINVMMSSPMTQNITQQWTNLYAIDKSRSFTMERNELLIELLNTLYNEMIKFEQNGFKEYIERWHSLDRYLNQKVKVITPDEVKIGVYRGLNLSGELLLECHQSLIHFNHNNISLRLLDSNIKIEK